MFGINNFDFYDMHSFGNIFDLQETEKPSNAHVDELEATEELKFELVCEGFSNVAQQTLLANTVKIADMQFSTSYEPIGETSLGVYLTNTKIPFFEDENAFFEISSFEDKDTTYKGTKRLREEKDTETEPNKKPKIESTEVIATSLQVENTVKAVAQSATFMQTPPPVVQVRTARPPVVQLPSCVLQTCIISPHPAMLPMPTQMAMLGNAAQNVPQQIQDQVQAKNHTVIQLTPEQKDKLQKLGIFLSIPNHILSNINNYSISIPVEFSAIKEDPELYAQIICTRNIAQDYPKRRQFIILCVLRHLNGWQKVTTFAELFNVQWKSVTAYLTKLNRYQIIQSDDAAERKKIKLGSPYTKQEIFEIVQNYL